MISKGDAITQWAVNQATEYAANEIHNIQELTGVPATLEEVELILSGAKRAWRNARQKAADIGTLAHNWIEQHLKGGEEPFPDSPEATRSCEAALKWLELHKWETREIEKQIFLPELHVAGIMDWWVYLDGVPAVPDWKTSNGIYNSYRYQTAAYAKAIELETGERVRERWILRIDKNTGEFEDVRLPASTLPADFAAFKAAATLYKREQDIKAECKKITKSWS